MEFDNPVEPEKNKIADLKKYSIAVALGHEGWKMIDYGSLTQWPDLKDVLKDFLGWAWDNELSQQHKTNLALAGFPASMDKLDICMWRMALTELRIIAGKAWLKAWESGGNETKVMVDGERHWSAAIKIRVGWNLQFMRYYRRELRRLST